MTDPIYGREAEADSAAADYYDERIPRPLPDCFTLPNGECGEEGECIHSNDSVVVQRDAE